MSVDEGWAQVEKAVEASLQQRMKMVWGFARFVYRQGYGALAPTPGENGAPRTWQQAGRELYGEKLFNETFRAVIAEEKAKENGDATSGVPTVRGDQGEHAETGEVAEGRQDPGRQDHKRKRRKSPAQPSAARA